MMGEKSNNTEKRVNQKLIDEVKAAKGKRSYRTYAEASGVSAAAICRIIKGEYVPSAGTIRLLTSEDARPENGVTYESMMSAAGYGFEPLLKTPSFLYSRDQMIDWELTVNAEHRKLPEEIVQYRTSVIGTVYNALINKNIVFQPIKDIYHEDYNRACAENYDMRIRLIDNHLSEWSFRIIYPVSRTEGFYERLLMYLLLLNPDSYRKVSWIINSVRFYERLKAYKDGISYRGDFSAILYDDNTGAFLEETYISHYSEDKGKENEIYLV